MQSLLCWHLCPASPSVPLIIRRKHKSACFPVSSTLTLICPTLLLPSRTDAGDADTSGGREGPPSTTHQCRKQRETWTRTGKGGRSGGRDQRKMLLGSGFRCWFGFFFENSWSILVEKKQTHNIIASFPAKDKPPSKVLHSQ